MLFAGDDVSDEMVMRIDGFVLGKTKLVIPVPDKMKKVGKFALRRVVFEIGSLGVAVPFQLFQNVAPETNNSVLSPMRKRKMSDAKLTAPTTTASQPEKLYIKVINSNPTLTVSIAHHGMLFFNCFILVECLVPDREQIIDATIKTNNDALESCIIKIRGDNAGLKVVDKQQMLLITVDENGTKAEKMINFARGEIRLGKCEKNTQFFCQFPVIAKPNSSGGSCIVYNLDFDMEYVKQTNESYKIKQQFDLNFYLPVMHFVYPKPLQDNLCLVQVSLECTAPCAIHVSNYQFEPSSKCKVVQDYSKEEYFSNASYTLLQDESMTIVFLVQATDMSSALADYGALTIDYVAVSEKTKQQTSLFNFALPIQWKWIWQQPYHVRLGFKALQASQLGLIVGHPYPMTVTLTRKQELPSTELWYEMNVDSNSWMMAGVKKQRFTFDEQGQHTWSCIFIPTVCGHLQMPKVYMYAEQSTRLQDDQVQVEYENDSQFFESHGDRIFVIPTSEEHQSPMCIMNDLLYGDQHNRPRTSSNASANSQEDAPAVPHLLLPASVVDAKQQATSRGRFSIEIQSRKSQDKAKTQVPDDEWSDTSLDSKKK